MELYHIGKHCATCDQLDYLPFTCRLCTKSYCRDHRDFSHHISSCSGLSDAKAVVCPLCLHPVPGASPSNPQVANAAVDRHIESGCPSPEAEAKRRKLANRCAVKGCKKREVVPFKCSTCEEQVCIGHRLPVDHGCRGKAGVAQPAGRRRTAVKG
ncbi:uncharacterized protein SPPG_09193 [Spizellomyces punctatus DAOM BR117]|uniref:AN1-type domain-containing protein n=1 Tax=Spizellomyces punctatus (strain DAOM BR117) TaxID=645134 RepID=A0A0L0HG83_SPIPD|nr:uncharacterized protein SPPG_09193 [Spizellomyces punctatus DAOM BR117]KND00073.1 hypothetical protein SPPG_09193 [Spizellomyces punctatus DAOM BR117]|eukprot:XP_016608112.1 hypothetical protein SPPG_09193 [Spizellomyces punctatus DAOM BR117]